MDGGAEWGVERGPTSCIGGAPLDIETTSESIRPRDSLVDIRGTPAHDAIWNSAEKPVITSPDKEHLLFVHDSQRSNYGL